MENYNVNDKKVIGSDLIEKKEDERYDKTNE